MHAVLPEAEPWNSLNRVLTRAYPVNPVMADAWLSAEIARAARDPGAKGVFRQAPLRLKHRMVKSKSIYKLSKGLVKVLSRKL